MRDIAFAIVMAGLLPAALIHPWIGVMGWAWISLMSPQAQTYGFMYGTPVAMAIGLATFAGCFFSRDPKKLPFGHPVAMLIVFTLWMCVTFLFSLVPTTENLEQLDKVLKINIFTLLTIAVLSTRRQVDVLLAVTAGSVAFFGVKGGLFTIMTGGADRVRGYGGFIAGNNEIALALIMVVPILYYFVLVSQRRWVRMGLWMTVLLCVIAALGTQSRGGLLGVLGMTFAFVARAQRRMRLLIPILATAVFVAAFMPDSWWQRMESIGSYQQDESAMGRINAWTVAWRIASEHFFGGGFVLEVPMIFDRYAPNPEFIAVAHSIYFQVLGQHGFVGLALYLWFWFATWRTARWIARHAVSPEDQALARMCEISFAGFAVGGAFLNLAYFDGPYYLMAALVVVRYKVLGNDPKRAAASPSAVPPPGADTPRALQPQNRA